MVELMGIVSSFAKKFSKRNNGSVGIFLGDNIDCIAGYIPLDRCPEIVAGCNKIAEMISTITIRLMSNTEDGDVRIRNELSRKIDIDPEKNMTRATWVHGIVMDMLLYGKGNAVVLPHTWKGTIRNLEPVAASRVSFLPIGYRDYRVVVDGKPRNPNDVLHFVYNPDKTYKWKGRGVDVVLRDIAKSLAQGEKTKNAFLASEFKPSIIVKVDALVSEFANKEGREKLMESYVQAEGKPWLIPAEQFEVEQVRPLSLSDLAIADTMDIDKRTAAAILGVPPFILGVGEYNKDEYNAFVQGRIMAIVKIIMQELTKKIIISEKWYFEGNVWSLLDYSLNELSNVLLAGADRGFISGNEYRDRIHMNPVKGLNEYNVLENYIPIDMTGKQKKLVQEKE